MHVDVLIVGAGISGVDAAYHVQDKCKGKTYAILEARDAIGGTWDLFKYPGIRSDSDMYTLGFPFRPWHGDKSLADGPSILAYVRETAAVYGIDKHIQFNRRVERASWSSTEARWTLDVRDTKANTIEQITCGFLFCCAGYYKYDAGYTPEFTGRERFRGQIVHPQLWPEELDYAGKRVVVIGSGATAVTVVPEMAKKAAHVTMLQRSPTYVMSVPARDPIAAWLKRRLPQDTAGRMARWKNVLVGLAFYKYSRRFPEHASKWIISNVAKATAGSTDIENFTPSYKVWDQRLCFVPDADLFDAIKRGSVSVVTDRIESFTETGLLLASGKTLDADIIVTATGLQLQLWGGMTLEVDGQRIESSKQFIFRGMMVSGVPNFAFAVGYTNASWTLKCDLASQYVCRLVNHLAERGYTRVTPRIDARVQPEPLMDFTSGYIQRVIDQLPRQGNVVPWKLYQNYVRDLWTIRHSRLEDPALELS
jgi:cation diffusion facilitator CzcD-associated flavoprotein CzcO